MGHHNTPISAERILGRLDGLCDGTDLVDLEKEGVASLGVDGLLDERWVGDSEVIADDLEFRVLIEVAPRLPVVLGEWVLDGDDWILLR